MLLLSPERRRQSLGSAGIHFRQGGEGSNPVFSQVLRPFRKPAWSGLSKPSTVGEMRWSARRSMSL